MRSVSVAVCNRKNVSRTCQVRFKGCRLASSGQGGRCRPGGRNRAYRAADGEARGNPFGTGPVEVRIVESVEKRRDRTPVGRWIPLEEEGRQLAVGHIRMLDAFVSQ